MKELTLRGTSLSIEDTVKKINSWYVGWAGYYKMTQYPSLLKAIEAHLRRRLRARIVSQQKRKRHLFDKLLKQGVSRKVAGIVYRNRNRWALSHSRALHLAFPNRWFIEKLGQKTMSDKRYPHWFNVETWIKLA